MKKLLSLIVFALFSLMASAQVSQTVNVTTPGTLGTLASAYLSTVTNLTVTGNIDARDVKTMRDKMPLLSVLDIGNVSIKYYSISPDTIYQANEIPQLAFKNKNSLKTITLPTNMLSIGSYAFSGCTGLIGSLTIPNTVTTIGFGAFSSCSGFTGNLFLPNKLTTIGASSFGGCSGFTSITLPNSVTRIGSFAFSGCSSCTTLTLLNSPISIGEYFSNCPKIDTLRTVNMINLKSIYLNYATISTVEILDGKDSIPASAFEGWRDLKNLTISASIKVVDISAFEDCRSLQSVILKGATKINDYAFYNCRGMSELVLPNTLTEIGVSSFENCRALKTLSLPNQVSKLGASAFWGCTGLTNIFFDANVTSIGDAAFWGCYKVNSITSKSLAPPLLDGVQVFGGIDNTSCELIVPSASLLGYKAAPQWKDFIKIKSDANGISQLVNPNLKVYTTASNIIIEGTSEGESVTLFTINGKQIQTQKSEGERMVLPAQRDAVYLVKTAGKTFKVIL